jgi:Flp pilus assembly protein TadG
MKELVNDTRRRLSGGLRRKKAGGAQKPHREGSRTLVRWRGEEDGNAVVELALTLPILVAILVAIFEFGVAFNNQLQLTQAVGAGAQYLQLIRSTTTDPCNDTITTIENSAPTLLPSSITLTLTMNGDSPVTGSTCPGKQSELAQGAPVTVYAKYPCNITIFGVNLVWLTTQTFSCNLTAQVTEYEY